MSNKLQIRGKTEELEMNSIVQQKLSQRTKRTLQQEEDKEPINSSRPSLTGSRQADRLDASLEQLITIQGLEVN